MFCRRVKRTPWIHWPNLQIGVTNFLTFLRLRWKRLLDFQRVNRGIRKPATLCGCLRRTLGLRKLAVQLSNLLGDLPLIPGDADTAEDETVTVHAG
jgi:hypothetical protein